MKPSLDTQALQLLVGQLADLLELPTKFESLTREVASLRAEVSTMRSALPPLLLPIPDAADALGISVSTLRRRIRLGEVPVNHFGRTVRVDLAAFRPSSEAEVVRLADAARRTR